MSPKLSVVVPIYNVEDYLQECLDSLAAQTFRDLEVVMVDDGSTDNSAVLAKEMAGRDDRFRLVQSPNQGPGLARNTGVRHARGEFLAFADADDVVPAKAYELMVGSLEKTGSDLACGNVHRLESGRTWQSFLHDGLFTATRTRTHIHRHPRLARDRTPWNKVYRREFWDRLDLEFPSGFYEDPPVTTRAHALAGSVDVLDSTVYLWRKRPGSITEDRYDWANLSQRMSSARVVRDGLAQYAPRLLPAYDEHVLVDVELRVLLDSLPRTEESHQGTLVGIGADLLAGVAPEVLRALPSITRLQLHLLARRMLPELLAVLRYLQLGGPKDAETVRRGMRSRWYATYPFFDDPQHGVPAEVYDVTDELVPVARVDRTYWAAGKLRIEGHAYISRLDASTSDGSRIRLWMLAGNRLGLVRVPIERVRRPDLTADTEQSAVSYEWSGFTAEIDPASLRILGRWRPVDWKLCVEITNQGVKRRRTVGNSRLAAQRWPLSEEVAWGVRVEALATDARFVLRVRQIGAMLTAHRRVGDDLELEGWTATDPGTASVVAASARAARTVRAKAAVTARPDGRFAFRARLPLADLVSGAETADWDLTLTGGIRLVLADDAPEARYLVPGREPAVEFALTRTKVATLRGVERSPRPVITRIGWESGGRLSLTGTCTAATCTTGVRPDRLLLRRKRSGEEHQVPLTWIGDAFSASFEPARLPVPAGELPLGKGKWDVLARTDAGEVPVVVERGVLRCLPEPHVAGLHEIAMHTYEMDALQLRVRLALAVDERGPYAQARLQTIDYPHYRTLPVQELALFDAYKGRQYSCNPRGIFEELRRRDTGIECVWVTEDGRFEAPAGARTVPVGSREHYEALARARFVFGNWAQHEWFVKREGQTYVQCWHGTPLKKLGYDVKDMPFKRTEGLNWMEHDVPQWDLLLAQNAFSTPLFRRAFRYDGEVLECGYPRNDLLLSPDRERIAAEVRQRLGIPPGKRVIMYAPTWRDDFHFAVGKRAFSLEFDLDRAQAALGGDHVLLLRTHYLVTDKPRSAGGDFVTDVSNHPDIAELYLIADALITDYSSAMFDFAVTGKPMIFYSYDLERYRDHVRGFYFDFEAEAPGPLLRTSDEVIDAVRDLDALGPRHADAYAAFAARYCPHDDGQAAARVLDRLLARSA